MSVKERINCNSILKSIVKIQFLLFLFFVCSCNSISKISSEDVLESEVPVFSKEGGFYSDYFGLSISSKFGNTIYYTLDGSDPRTSKTALKYKTEIPIFNNTNNINNHSSLTNITLFDYRAPGFKVEKGIVVRAVIKDRKYGFGKVVSNSYFISKKAPYYSQMKVISMLTDSDYLFDEENGIYMVGTKYYEWLKKNPNKNYNPGDVLNVTNYNSDGKENEIPVSIQIFENGKSVLCIDVGARIAGNWSRANPQKSFRFFARKEYGSKNLNYKFFEDLKAADGSEIISFDKITLRNGGNDYQELRFRDALVHDLVSDSACDIMAAEPCILFINGEFWGFYMIREKTDGEYIKSHYGIKKKDVAVIKNSEVEEGEKSDLDEFAEFSRWAASAPMKIGENYKKFCDSMDVQSFMDYMAIQTYINNFDWASSGFSNNWQVWHSKTVNPKINKADGKWRFILYDTEFSSGIYTMKETSYEYDLLNRLNVTTEHFNFPRILKNLCKNEEFLNRFYKNYLKIIEEYFAPNVVCKKIDEYAKEYKTAICDTYKRFGIEWASHNFDGEVEDLKLFYRNRPEYAKRYLDTFYKNMSKKNKK